MALCPAAFAGLRISAIQGPALVPGRTTPILLRVANDGPSTALIYAAGLSAYDGGREITQSLRLRPLSTYPVAVPPAVTLTLRFEATPPIGGPAGRPTVSGNVFGYDTAVGCGVNLLSNPSLEAGPSPEPGTDPPAWIFGQDYPASANRSLCADAPMGGLSCFRIDKQAGIRQSYLQQMVPGSLLKPSTTYTLAAWTRSRNPSSNAAAQLCAWWYDDAYRAATPATSVGDAGWTRLATAFTTGPVPPKLAVVRLQVVGPADVTVWFDNVTLSEGGADGGLVSASLPAPLRPVSGDANGDGRVDLTDVVLALRAYQGLLTPTPEQLMALDANGNGVVELAEVVACVGAAVSN
jgi:hypothetical protein